MIKIKFMFTVCVMILYFSGSNNGWGKSELGNGNMIRKILQKILSLTHWYSWG